MLLSGFFFLKLWKNKIKNVGNLEERGMKFVAFYLFNYYFGGRDIKKINKILIKLKHIEKKTYNDIYQKIIINQCADNNFWRENIFYVFENCYDIYPHML